MFGKRNSRRQRVPALEPRSILDEILSNSAIGAVLLLLAAVLAMVCANWDLPLGSRTLAEWYQWLWHVELGFHIGDRPVAQSLHVWINDGLMAIFFFQVGLEIKRELLVGELASPRKAALPIAAAFGGMLVPALLFLAVNWNQATRGGWGIPMATDIAFAGGVLGLLSRRVPTALAVFLIALAIVDDLGAVLVIAVFYTSSIDAVALELGLACIVGSLLLSLMGVRSTLIFVLLGITTWFGFLKSGVHATIAGVLFAFTVPINARYDTPLFPVRMRELLKRFDDAEDHVHPRMVNARQQQIVQAIEAECIHVESPLQRVEHRLHPWIAFVIMPLFAFANAGIRFEGTDLLAALMQPVAIGIALGLVVGKQAGIMALSWLSVRLGWAELPAGIGWRQLWSVSWLAGIGFTMSLFIAGLAFPEVDSSLSHGAVGTAELHHHAGPLQSSKLAVLLSSLVAGSIGTLLLWWNTGKYVDQASRGET